MFFIIFFPYGRYIQLWGSVWVYSFFTVCIVLFVCVNFARWRSVSQAKSFGSAHLSLWAFWPPRVWTKLHLSLYFFSCSPQVLPQLICNSVLVPNHSKSVFTLEMNWTILCLIWSLLVWLNSVSLVQNMVRAFHTCYFELVQTAVHKLFFEIAPQQIRRWWVHVLNWVLEVVC